MKGKWKMTLETYYLANQESAKYYFSADRKGNLTKEGVLYYARQFGCGLAEFNKKEVDKLVKSTYSVLYIKNALSHSAIEVDAKEWTQHIWKGYERGLK